MGRVRIRKTQSERKRESEMGPKPGLLKNNSNDGAQIRKTGPLRCKSTKCHNDRYAYKTRECLKIHNVEKK